MKPLKIRLGEKLYTSGKITAWMAREAIAIHKDALSLARRGKEAHESSSAEDAAELLLNLMDDIATRKAKTKSSLTACPPITSRLFSKLAQKQLRTRLSLHVQEHKTS